MTLFCIQHGITLDSSYLTGRQESMERAPIMVESTVLGRKLLPGALVQDPLWVVRAGDGAESLLVVGNEKPRSLRGDVQLIDRYFGGSPLLGEYYGGLVRHGIEGGRTTIGGVQVEARGLRAFKTLGLLHTNGQARATTSWFGDGVTINVEIAVQSDRPGRLELNTFTPMYETRSVTVNGGPVVFQPGEPLSIASGRRVIKVQYANRVFDFTAEDWKAVDLIREGRTNFCIAADRGFTFERHGRKFEFGFERGTAMMLNEFLELFDQEDGRGGSLEPAPFVDRAADGLDGWTVVLRQERQLPHGRVRIDRSGQKQLFVEGPTQARCAGPWWC